MPRKPKVKIQPKERIVDLAKDNEYEKFKSIIHNGLSEAIMGFTPGGIGTQLSQTDTLFLNERWYMLSNMRQVLSQMYVEHGLVQTVVNVPVDDGMRGGVEVKSKQLSPDQIDELHTHLEREDILNTVVGRAQKWNRLFGGAGILVITDQDPEDELIIDQIGADSDLEFRAVDMWELFYDKQNVEGFNPAIEDPRVDYYKYYGSKVHKSRVMKLKGLEAPSFIRPRLRGWGFSIMEGVVQSVNQYFKSKNLAFEVLDEFKLDIFKIKNLTQSLLDANGVARIHQRVALANQQKNFQNALTMDSEDDYLQKQLSFAGLAEMMKDIRIQIACDFRMPLSKIFGLSATGFGSGEDDLENYNSMVEADVRAKSKYDIIKIIEISCQKLFQFVPEDIKIEFKPLRVLSAEQEENVKTQKFTRVLQARQANEITTREFRDAINKDALLPIQLDTSISELELKPEPPIESGEQDAANKDDTQKSKLAPKTKEAK